MPHDPNWNEAPYLTQPELWQKLKPLARQMRHDPTPAEECLWQHIRNRQIAGKKFRRQHTIDRFIVDFYCADAQLVIEVDGDIHDYTIEEDAIRTEFLESHGLRVIRFANDDVFDTLDEVITVIRAAVESAPSLDES